MCYPEINFTKRTDADFRNKSQEEHHMGISLFEQLPAFDLINNIPIDYMHAVLLGVCKRMLCHKIYGWVFGKPPYKLRSRDVFEINNRLKKLKRLNLAEEKLEILMKQNGIRLLNFDFFLLYTGPIVLRNIVPKQMYNNFWILTVSLTILLSKRYSSQETYISYAGELLKHFISNCKTLYDAGFISLNVHLLLHLQDTVLKFGLLDQCSAFPFENYMQILKSKIRKSAQPLQQIINRITEETFLEQPESHFKVSSKSLNFEFCMEHNDGPLFVGFANPQYKKIKNSNFAINVCKFADSFIQLEDETIIRVVNFACKNNESDLYALGYIYNCTKPLFTKPCSSSLININYIARTSRQIVCKISLISSKLAVLSLKEENTDENLVAFSLIHNF